MCANKQSSVFLVEIFINEATVGQCDTKRRLIESFCLNFYCPYLWYNRTKRYLSKLRVAHNNIFRNILSYGKRDSASVMFVSSRIDNFDERYRKSCFSFSKRLRASDNLLLHHACMFCTITDGF